MPAAERRMLLLLLALGVAGQGVRYWITKPGQAPGGVQLLAGLTPGSPTAHRDSSMQQARPLAPDEQINIDSAPASEIARLPRVGARLAKTIVADRQERGAFGSLNALDRVSGVGPGLIKILAPHLRFAPVAAAQAPGGLPAGTAVRESPVLDLNSATLDELDALPGIGPAKGRAIIAYRSSHGAFKGPDELGRVPGISASLVKRLRDRIYVR